MSDKEKTTTEEKPKVPQPQVADDEEEEGEDTLIKYNNVLVLNS